jgi:hypothetical protein
VSDLEADVQSKIKWAKDVEAALIIEIKKQTADLVKAVEALHQTEKELQERTEWALRLNQESASWRAGGALSRVPLGEAGPQGGLRPGDAGKLTWPF